MRQGSGELANDNLNMNNNGSELLLKPVSTIKRVFLIVIGSIALVLGSIGIVVPLLPTTPFLLVASWCYIRSSKRLYRWLLTRKFFKKHINRIIANKGLPLRAKVFILGSVWAMLIILMVFVFDSLLMRLIAFKLGAIKTLFFIFFLKTTK